MEFRTSAPPRPLAVYTLVPTSCSGATLSGSNATDYGVAYTTSAGNFNVAPAPLTVLASNTSMTQGNPPPTITASYAGFVNGDSASSLSTRPTCSTIATASSPVSGNPYVSYCSGAYDSEYTISYLEGLVTVQPGTADPCPGTPTYGYWLVGSDGGIFAFGSAQFYGSTGNIKLQRPVVGISPTANKAGYWLVASDGGIFAFGDAGYFGSIPGDGLSPAGSGLPHSLDAPIVAMVPVVRRWRLFHGGLRRRRLRLRRRPVRGSCPGIGGCSGAAVAVVPDASGNGYWLVTQTGNVYAFGDAPFYGAPGNQGSPVTSAVRTADGGGYWVLLADGAVYAYGDAAAVADPSARWGASTRPRPSSPMLAAAATGSPPPTAASSRTATPRMTGPCREPPQRLHHRRHRILTTHAQKAAGRREPHSSRAGRCLARGLRCRQAAGGGSEGGDAALQRRDAGCLRGRGRRRSRAAAAGADRRGRRGGAVTVVVVVVVGGTVVVVVVGAESRSSGTVDRRGGRRGRRERVIVVRSAGPWWWSRRSSSWWWSCRGAGASNHSTEAA